jgi:hypothetical protein
MPKNPWMTGRPETGPTTLERLDLLLATGLCGGTGPADELLATAQGFHERRLQPGPADPRFLAGLLRLRGMHVRDDDALKVLTGKYRQLPPLPAEHVLLRGLANVLHELRERARGGVAPDGRFLVAAWKSMTSGLSRYRGVELRTDPPWDAVLYVSYPEARQLPALVESFDAEHRFRDLPQLFDGCHPVRQAFRIFWRCARIAPFQDFNMVIAWIAMSGHLLAKGYPLLVPESTDQELCARLVAGPPPTRLVQWEGRLVEELARGR